MPTFALSGYLMRWKPLLRLVALVAVICTSLLALAVAIIWHWVKVDMAPLSEAEKAYIASHRADRGGFANLVEEGYVISPSKDKGADALAALADKSDWLRVGRAAETLARYNIKEAIPELQRVADTHWFSPVRKTALHAIGILKGNESAMPETDPQSGSLLVEKYRAQDFPAFSSIAPPPPAFIDTLFETLSQKLKPARDACFWRLQPRIAEVEYRSPETQSVVKYTENLELRRFRPKQAISFAGGKLLGYDEGEFGSGTVFYRKGEIPQLFATSNVAGFYRMPFGVLVICNADMLDEGLIYLAVETADGRVSVRFFQRLPSPPYGFISPSSDKLIINCRGMEVTVLPTGEVRFAERMKKQTAN